jgi:5-methylcytosine-specific restriction endonuclease McrA
MLANRHTQNIDELKNHFNAVIDWIRNTFTTVEREMKGLDWGRLYDKYKDNVYDPEEVARNVKELHEDPYVKNRRGIYEYILDGMQNTQLLDIRVFDDATKRKVYAAQTEEAKERGISNCPICADSINSREVVYELKDMEADHVTAWSKQGSSDIDNCQMLCVRHNREKGNK